MEQNHYCWLLILANSFVNFHFVHSSAIYAIRLLDEAEVRVSLLVENTWGPDGHPSGHQTRRRYSLFTRYRNFIPLITWVHVTRPTFLSHVQPFARQQIHPRTPVQSNINSFYRVEARRCNRMLSKSCIIELQVAWRYPYFQFLNIHLLSKREK